MEILCVEPTAEIFQQIFLTIVVYNTTVIACSFFCIHPQQSTVVILVLPQMVNAVSPVQPTTL